MAKVIGVDIGGTNIVVGVIDTETRAVAGLQHEPTRAREGADAVIGRAVQMIGASQRSAIDTWGPFDVAGVGIGCPGPIDTTRGIVVTTPNLGWSDMPLRDRVSEAVHLPAVIDNDASCAILGEWWNGAARDTAIVVGFTVGTGIGGGIVLNGEIFHGASDVAGEFGHMTIDSTGRRCNCGNYGCLEAYASGTAIAERTMEELASGSESTLSSCDHETITAATVYQAAHEGDELALEIVRDTGRFLGTGVANVVNIFNPELVVVCGGVTAAGEALLRPLRQEVQRRAFRPAVDACRITLGALDGTAGVYGAAAVFCQRHAIPL